MKAILEEKPSNKGGIIPERLVKLRKDAGLSQRALADAVGCSEKTIFRIEKGEFPGSSLLISKICKTLMCSRTFLTDDNGVEEPFDETQKRIINAIIEKIRSGDETPTFGTSWYLIFPIQEQRDRVYKLIGKTIYETIKGETK